MTQRTQPAGTNKARLVILALCRTHVMKKLLSVKLIDVINVPFCKDSSDVDTNKMTFMLQDTRENQIRL